MDKWIEMLLLRVMALLVLAIPALADWDIARFGAENHVDLRTVGPEEGEHWSRLWIVEVEGALYLRLGGRAAKRFEANTEAPSVSIRIAGEEIERVKAEPAPEATDAVAAAMAEKYWTDVVIRHFPHPLTIRLSPQTYP